MEKTIMRQSEIWIVDLNPTIGAEIKKQRPAVIINDNNVGILPLRIIVPLTDWKEHYKDVSWMVEVEADKQTGLAKKSAIDCFQIRCVSENRLIRQIGKIDETTFREIQQAVSHLISINIS